jgi:GntR family transcriptional regulator
LRTYVGRPDHQVARELSLGQARRVFALERLRLVDGRPLSFQVSYLPAAIGEEAARADLAITPLGQVLAFKLGIELAAARESVSAVQLDARAARVLGCRRGVPAFRSDRVSTAADGAPVVYDRVLIPGDRFRITRQFQYDGAAALRAPRPAGPGFRSAEPSSKESIA